MKNTFPVLCRTALTAMPRRSLPLTGTKPCIPARTVLLGILFWFVLIPAAYAAHPLITDDAGTQGRGKFQFELDNQISYKKDQQPNDDGTSTTVKTTAAEMKLMASYGIADTVDLVLGVPYQWQRVETDGAGIAKADGLADISFEVKWRFFEKNGFSLAVKPGLTLPAGDKDKGLGTGRTGYTFFFIATKDWEPLAFHANLGYRRNENNVDQRDDIWHASLAAEWKLRKNFRLVANAGVETNTDRASSIDPAFILGGVVYSLADSLDLDLGIKGGLTPVDPDYTLLAGVTYRF